MSEPMVRIEKTVYKQVAKKLKILDPKSGNLVDYDAFEEVPQDKKLVLEIPEAFYNKHLKENKDIKLLGRVQPKAPGQSGGNSGQNAGTQGAGQQPGSSPDKD